MNVRRIVTAILILALSLTVPAFAGSLQAHDEIEFFEKRIRPILAEHCFKCHAQDAKKPKGKLLLDSRAGFLIGGESGKPALVPGHPEQSKFIEAISYKNVDLQMPPRAKLPDAVIADLTAWVKNGAPWGKDIDSKPGADKYIFDLEKRKREHWAWQPLAAGKPPQVKNVGWPLSDADRHILAGLEAKGLAPAAAADPRTLVRRLYIDLTGLPPSSADMDAFLRENPGAMTDQAALEKLVDRLLASPRFGERWARHWLDLVRYAESRGHEFDYTIPGAHHYRDYVIRAVNLDVPYDQFVREHLAGDLMSQPRTHPIEKFNESILGTGFWFLGEQVHSPVDICQDRADRVDNKLDVMSKTFLGMTVACARCHDHKFDAISTKDYYALAGFLESTSYRLARFDSLDHNHKIAESLAKLNDRSRAPLRKALAAKYQPGLERLAEYLQAARDVRLMKNSKEEIARERKLNPAILDQWLVHLERARKDAGDPFHPLAIPAENLAPLQAKWRKSLAVPETTNDCEVIIDYARCAAEDWIQDGDAFGPRPVRPGDMRLSAKPLQPIAQIFDRAAAHTDAIWDVLKPAAGSDNEPGPLGKMPRSSRTLLTPSFRLKADRVWCLVRGQGMMYASVESHVMIAGPLHGELVQNLKPADGFRWVALNLARYKGLRAHIEFTGAPGSDFAVAMVVQGNNAPQLSGRPNAALLDMIESAPTNLAAGYQRLFAEVTQKLSVEQAALPVRTGKAACSTEDHAQLANWLIQHADLFAADTDQPDRLAEIAAPYLAERARLVAGIKTVSRLAPAMLDGNGVDENVFIRGTYKTPGELASRRLLEALVGRAPVTDVTGSGRLQLARQMTDPAVTPLLPRVMVNRVWHHLFGRGIVASTDNFGVLGDRPTHPELLDHLAQQFVRDGWSLKKTIRRLVLSRTYQMSSRSDDTARQIDPQNLLLQHMRIRRLEGEAIRDAILQISGSLDGKMFGPSIPVHLTAFQDGRGRPKSGPVDGGGRRSLYLSVRRNFLSPFLMAFDTPTPFTTVGRRTVSNVPAQALILLNDPFVHQQAGRWARHVAAEEKTSQGRITAMYQAAFCRPPSAAEMDACLEFLDSQGRLGDGPMSDAVWTDLAHVLINAKEFIYLN